MDITCKVLHPARVRMDDVMQIETRTDLLTTVVGLSVIIILIIEGGRGGQLHDFCLHQVMGSSESIMNSL